MPCSVFFFIYKIEVSVWSRSCRLCSWTCVLRGWYSASIRDGVDFSLFIHCPQILTGETGMYIFIVVPCMLFQSLLYCSNSCTSLHFKTLKSHTKTLNIRPYMFRSSLKPSSWGPWLYFARLLNWNIDLHLL